MIKAVPGRALRGRGAFAVLGGVIRGVIGFDAARLVGVLGEDVPGILRLLSFLAPTAGPSALQCREEGVRLLRHRGGVPLVPMDDAGSGLFTAS